MTRPALLFADEPTGNLDFRTGLDILDALWRTCVDRGQTIVLVTHDAKAAAYADRVLVIGDGRIQDEIVLGRRDDHAAAPADRAPRAARPVAAPCAASSRTPGASLVARPARSLLTDLRASPSASRVLVAALAVNAGLDASIDRTVASMVGRADLRVVRVHRGRAVGGDADRARRGARRRAHARPPSSGAASSAPQPGRPTAHRARHRPGHRPGARAARPRPAARPRRAPSTRSTRPPRSITERLRRGRAPRRRQRARRSCGAGAPLHVRVVGVLAGDGPALGSAGRTVVLPIAHRGARSTSPTASRRRRRARSRASPASTSCSRPGPTSATVTAAIERALTVGAVRAVRPARHRRLAARVHRRRPGDDGAAGRDHAVRGGVHDPQHPRDDRRGAGPGAGAAACRGRRPRAGRPRRPDPGARARGRRVPRWGSCSGSLLAELAAAWLRAVGHASPSTGRP